jgi:SAM-dependent methyltransferase
MNNPAEHIAEAIGGGRWLRGYVRGKLQSDPVFAAGLAEVGRSGGRVVDLGCGLGLFGMWLRVHGVMVPYRGCDLSGWKIASGLTAAKQMGWRDWELTEGDMTSFPLDGAGVVCAFDVLHYLPPEGQKRLIERLAQAARNDAVVLVRTGVRGCGWRSAVTLAEEWWTRLSGWIRGGAVNFPDLAMLRRQLAEADCVVEVRPLWGRTPFSSHWLRVAARR